MNAFIPAAGLGTRLLPVTEHIPKPLLPILGASILEHVLDKIFELDIKKVGINLHHLGEDVKSWVKQSNYKEDATFYSEKKILGTGGALYNARRLLKKDTFIVHNGDVIADIDMLDFHNHHKKSGNIITLATHNIEKFNQVGLNEFGKVVAIGKNRVDTSVKKWVTFTGIAIYEPEFLNYLPSGESHVTTSWLKAVSDGKKIGTFDVSSFDWSDLGTIESYVEKISTELDKRRECRFIGNNVYVPLDCNISGRVVLESNCRIGIGVEIENSIVLSGATVKGGSKIKNRLIVADVEIPIKFPAKKENVSSSTISGGSNRVYERVAFSESLFGISLKSNMDDPDFNRQIEFTKAFRKAKLPVSNIIMLDLKRRMAVFEDLGSKDLYGWILKNKNNSSNVLNMYKRVLDSLIKFQTINISKIKGLKKQLFNENELLWETKYFLDRFVKGYMNIYPENEQDLLIEFNALAKKTNSFPKTLMHRDFQSTNILLHHGEIYFIDFQGAKIGLPAYDAVSLIFDPYAYLDKDVSDELCEYYVLEFCKVCDYDKKLLEKSLLYCVLQRHMQALGAYGYLFVIKGKEWFKQHIPPALDYLKREATVIDEEFPNLSNLINSL